MAEKYGNPRGAGRKAALSPEQISQIKQERARGKTITALAKEYGISRQTLSGYLNPCRDEKSICRSAGKWEKLNREFEDISVKDYTMRMDFMGGDELCTIILVDFKDRKISIRNCCMDLLHRAFGVVEEPDWTDFKEFLEERCLPRTRDHMRLILSDLGLDFYDPLSIIEKTQGRMAEDQHWIRVTYFQPQ
ncbi:MAG: Hin recombinase [Lachnospiraceae bacterium]|nr:Hin recombinase [Lachnospiraceae bacterium]